MIDLECAHFRQEFISSMQKRKNGFNADIIDKIIHYFFLLKKSSELSNLTGYHKIDDYIDFHLIDTIVLNQQIDQKPKPSIVDVGTGAGIPGLLLSIMRPEANVLLIDSRKKKTDFLNRVVKQIPLYNCNVLCERIEKTAHNEQYREKFDIVTARAIGSLPITMELTAPLAKTGGNILLPRGSNEEEESKIEYLSSILGNKIVKMVPYKLPRRNQDFVLFVLEKIMNTPDKYPRKPGQLKKRPL
ncbi:MAG: 16S rRNA (guanine(527)-N(7))-methyltransferase RsmG [Candidatus Omnitrophota bacterium]|jgi:16S rRNA (guanine527-N7)-methyltransferase|nr:MAG: 16S rRNA (guanine(527)-N(7))-methyltransferase RsmG [Candidatus Omnitrophota bacterium]